MLVEERGKDTYRLTISGGYDYEEKQIRVRRTVKASTKRELKRLITQFQNDFDNGLLGNSGSLTVYGLCRNAIDNYFSIDLSPSTLRGYESLLKRIEKTIGKVKVSKVSRKDVQQYVNDLAKTETAYSSKQRLKDSNIEPVYLSTKTIKSTYSFLHNCFEVAIIWELIGINPCNHIKLPKTYTKEPKALNEVTMPRFIEALDALDLDTKVLFELALFCGLRRSEILGLTIDSIKDTHITINKARLFENGKNIVKEPKTTKSNRNIVLPKFLEDDIKALIKEHKEKRLKHGQDYINSEFLIHGSFGEPLMPNTCNQRLRRFLKKNDIEKITFHELRHTHATMVNYFGKDLTEISQQLGHSNLTTTLNIYTHMFDEVSHSSKSIAHDFDNYVQKVKNN